MRLAAHQPAPFPSVQYFMKLRYADVFLLRDDVRLSKGDWQHRFALFDPQQGRQVVSIPLVNISRSRPWRDLQIHTPSAAKARLRRIIHDRYRRAPYFDTVFPAIDAVLGDRSAYLLDLCQPFLQWALAYLKLDCDLRCASSLTLPEGKNQSLISACRDCGANVYLTGKGGWHYLQLNLWRCAAIGLGTLQWEAIPYPQLRADHTFIANLSIIDLLFMRGEDAGQCIEQGRISYLPHPNTM